MGHPKGCPYHLERRFGHGRYSNHFCINNGNSQCLRYGLHRQNIHTVYLQGNSLHETG